MAKFRSIRKLGLVLILLSVLLFMGYSAYLKGEVETGTSPREVKTPTLTPLKEPSFKIWRNVEVDVFNQELETLRDVRNIMGLEIPGEWKFVKLASKSKYCQNFEIVDQIGKKILDIKSSCDIEIERGIYDYKDVVVVSLNKMIAPGECDVYRARIKRNFNLYQYGQGCDAEPLESNRLHIGWDIGVIKLIPGGVKVPVRAFKYLLSMMDRTSKITWPQQIEL